MGISNNGQMTQYDILMVAAPSRTLRQSDAKRSNYLLVTAVVAMFFALAACAMTGGAATPFIFVGVGVMLFSIAGSLYLRQKEINKVVEQASSRMTPTQKDILEQECSGRCPPGMSQADYVKERLMAVYKKNDSRKNDCLKLIAVLDGDKSPARAGHQRSQVSSLSESEKIQRSNMLRRSERSEITGPQNPRESIASTSSRFSTVNAIQNGD